MGRRKNAALSAAVCMIATVSALLLTAVPAYASATTGEVRAVVSETHAYAKPDIDSDTALDLDIDGKVFVTGETGDYYEILYQDETLYVPKYAIDGTEPPQAIGEDIKVNKDAASKAASARESEEALREASGKEEDAKHQYNEMFSQMYEEYIRNRRNSRIWGAVIIGLIIAVFVAGFITIFKDKKVKEDSSL